MFQLPSRARNEDSGDRALRSLIPAALALGTAAAILIVPVPLNAAIVIVPAGAALLLFYPILIPLGIIASVPVQDAIPLPEEVPVTATRAITAVAAALLPFILIRWGKPLRWSKFLISVLLLMAAMSFSLLNAESLSAGGNELYRWLVAGFTFWLVLQFIRSRGHILAALSISALLAGIQGGVGIVQSLSGAGPASFEIGAGFSRSFGTFGMPNSFAAYMEVVTLPLVPIAVWALRRTWSRIGEYRVARLKGYVASSAQRRAALLSIGFLLLVSSGAIIGLASIATSFSRGGWLGSIAALAVMVVLLGRRALITTGFLASILSITLFFVAPGAVLSEIQERFGQLVDQARIGDVRGVQVTADNFATVERMAHWQTAIAMWDEHPWLGVGAGNFDERFTEFAVHPLFNESQGHAHNYYLHLLAETGIVGLLAYTALVVAAIYLSWRAYRSSDGLASAIGIGALGMTTALVVHNIFENLHVLNISLHMMLVWALAVIAAALPAQEQQICVGRDP